MGRMPELAINCINSWKKHLPDYELILWNEDNFDINTNQYAKEAYKAKKYAFVTDYVRLYALYHHGGIYMDTDVEVLRSLDGFLEHKAFTGCENDKMCVTGIMAAERGHIWIKELLDDYLGRKFKLSNGTYDGTPNTKVITELTISNFGWAPENKYQVLKYGLNIYPFEYFCAKDWKTGKVIVTEDTCTIHHFSGSWHTKLDKFKQKIIYILGPKGTRLLVDIKKKIKGKLS